MKIGDFISIEPAPSAALSNPDEVDVSAREDLARRVQLSLRGKIDTGLQAPSRQVRVAAEGNRLVIDEEDPAGVLAAAGEQVREEDQSTVHSVDELFELGSGVPSTRQADDGSIQLVFRTISLDDIFGEHRQEQQDLAVEQTVTETLRTSIVDAYEEAAATVERRHPGDT